MGVGRHRGNFEGLDNLSHVKRAPNLGMSLFRIRVQQQERLI